MQNFQCPPQCICKGHVIFCSHTSVDIYSVPVNVTLLYFSYITDSTQQPYEKQLKTYHNLSLVNFTNSKIFHSVINNFLLLVPNLRVLIMKNASITDLSSSYFTNLLMLNYLDLQGNFIHSLTSGCFNGSISVLWLDLHGLMIQKIEPHAFEGLLFLHLLNLSYNKLAHLYDGRFKYLISLKVLDLRGNSFKNIQLHTFTGLYVSLFTTYEQTCCYASVLSACYSVITR